MILRLVWTLALVSLAQGKKRKEEAVEVVQGTTERTVPLRTHSIYPRALPAPQ
jgi:hypothetical protein